MRIVHVVSALSPDNRFGGPTRVALDLARGLDAHGHDVVVVGAGVGYDSLPDSVGGVQVELARGVNFTPFLGWASLVAPGLPGILRRRIRSADIVHIHLARDVVTLTGGLAARRSGLPYVVQTHGMIDAAGGALASAVDRFATRRVARGSALALVLTDAEEQQLQRFGVPADRIERFPNGVDAAGPTRDLQPHRPVLFLARLHPRKGAAAFARAAVEVAQSHPGLRFAIVGPDEGDGPAVDRILETASAEIRARIERVGGVPTEEARRWSASALISVLPAEAEPFGMTVVEAMSAGRPVLLAASAELALPVREAGAGWTFGADGDFPTLERAIEAILRDPDGIERAGRNAAALVDRRYRIDAVVERLADDYERLRGASRRG